MQSQCLNLSSFLRPQSPLWPKSGPNGAQENAWTRSDWAAWFIPTIVVQEWASRWTMDVARPSMVLQLWVWLRWTSVIILHKWVFLAILTSPKLSFAGMGLVGPSPAQGIVAPLPFVETCSMDSILFGGDSFFSLFFPYIFWIILISWLVINPRWIFMHGVSELVFQNSLRMTLNWSANAMRMDLKEYFNMLDFEINVRI